VGVCVNGIIQLDTEKMRIIKCDHCGGDPECARVCPTGAIQYGPSATLTTVDMHSKMETYLKEIKRTAEIQESRGDV